jgi:hypothetical protein
MAAETHPVAAPGAGTPGKWKCYTNVAGVIEDFGTGSPQAACAEEAFRTPLPPARIVFRLLPYPRGTGTGVPLMIGDTESPKVGAMPSAVVATVTLDPKRDVMVMPPVTADVKIGNDGEPLVSNAEREADKAGFEAAPAVALDPAQPPAPLFPVDYAARSLSPEAFLHWCASQAAHQTARINSVNSRTTHEQIADIRQWLGALAKHVPLHFTAADWLDASRSNPDAVKYAATIHSRLKDIWIKAPRPFAATIAMYFKQDSATFTSPDSVFIEPEHRYLTLAEKVAFLDYLGAIQPHQLDLDEAGRIKPSREFPMWDRWLAPPVPDTPDDLVATNAFGLFLAKRTWFWAHTMAEEFLGVEAVLSLAGHGLYWYSGEAVNHWMTSAETRALIDYAVNRFRHITSQNVKICEFVKAHGPYAVRRVVRSLTRKTLAHVTANGHVWVGGPDLKLPSDTASRWLDANETNAVVNALATLAPRN